MALGLEIYIGGNQVDLLDGDTFDLAINYQISDVNEPDTRQAFYSKTIKLPSSKTNDELFGWLFDLAVTVDTSGSVNFSPDFNPNLKADALVIYDGVEVFKGIAQLTSIEKTDNDKVEYNVNLFGNLIDLFKAIGENELRDLDFSEFDHVYNRTNVENSWDTEIVYNGGSLPFATGTGYVYPLIDYGFTIDQVNYELEHIYPAIYAKQYVDKIFEAAGFIYESDFFNSTYFKNLIIPFTGNTFGISSAEVTDRQFQASTTSDQDIQVVNSGTSTGQGRTTIQLGDDSTGNNFDNGGNYNTVTYAYTVPDNGWYNFTIYPDIRAYFVPDTTAAVIPNLLINATVQFEVNRGSGYQVLSAPYTLQIIDQDEQAGARETGTTNNSPTLVYNPAGQSTIGVQSLSVQLEAGDLVRVAIYRSITSRTPSLGFPFYSSSAPTVDVSGDAYIRVKSGAYWFNTVPDTSYVEGNTISMTNAVPYDIKQRDFLMSLIKMFNLYIEQDKDNLNKLIIEPRDDYYYTTVNSSTVLDWSDKLDISQPLEILPMGALEAREYEFSYKEDGDFLNQRYQDVWGEVYGQRNKEVDNDFLVDTKKIDVLFSPTPSSGFNSSDRVIPRIVNIDDNGISTPYTGNIRILQYSGLKNTASNWYINDSAGATTYTQYPYAGMVNDPYNPTEDLCWNVPLQIFWNNSWGVVTYTNSNLYNKYWKKFVNEISNPNSKIVRGWFRLRPSDIASIDFRKLYYFDYDYFRLNKVIDYTPNNDGLTLCEFLKIQADTDFTATLTVADDVWQGDLSPKFPPTTDSGDNVGFSDNTSIKVQGTDNIIGGGATRSTIIGDDNLVGAFRHDIFIIGDDNVINGNHITALNSSGNVFLDVENCTFINTFDKLPADFAGMKNTVVIGGVAAFGEGAFQTITSSKTISDERYYRYNLCDASSGNLTITLPDPTAVVGVELNFKKIDNSANTITLNASTNGSTIDDQNTQVLTSQYDNLTIVSDGTEWWII